MYCLWPGILVCSKNVDWNVVDDGTVDEGDLGPITAMVSIPETWNGMYCYVWVNLFVQNNIGHLVVSNLYYIIETCQLNIIKLTQSISLWDSCLYVLHSLDSCVSLSLTSCMIDLIIYGEVVTGDIVSIHALNIYLDSHIITLVTCIHHIIPMFMSYLVNSESWLISWDSVWNLYSVE